MVSEHDAGDLVTNTDPELDEDAPLSQYGTIKKGFRKRPRFDEGEKEVSLLLGTLSVGEAKGYVIPRYQPNSNDLVRYSSVDCLASKGFSVRHTGHKRSPYHVSVEYDGEWNEDMDEAFDDCFSSPEGLPDD